MLEWGGWGWSVCNGREEMAKARLQLLLLHFFSLSQRSIHVDQNHDRTLLSNFSFCWEKTFWKIGLESAAGQEDPCMLLHVTRNCRNGHLSGSSSSAALVFTTRSNFICRSQFWHFHWNVPRGMFGVTFRMVCDALYGPSATTQCPNWLHSFVLVQFCLAEREFCAILHQFPILAAFLHRTIFLRTQLHSCARAVHRRLNAPQCSWHCHFHVNNPLNICANDRALVHNIWPPMCTCTQCAHVNYIYVLMALRLLCAPLPWWTIC